MNARTCFSHILFLIAGLGFTSHASAQIHNIIVGVTRTVSATHVEDALLQNNWADSSICPTTSEVYSFVPMPFGDNPTAPYYTNLLAYVSLQGCAGGVNFLYERIKNDPRFIFWEDAPIGPVDLHLAGHAGSPAPPTRDVSACTTMAKENQVLAAIDNFSNTTLRQTVTQLLRREIKKLYDQYYDIQLTNDEIQFGASSSYYHSSFDLLEARLLFPSVVVTHNGQTKEFLFRDNDYMVERANVKISQQEIEGPDASGKCIYHDSMFAWRLATFDHMYLSPTTDGWQDSFVLHIDDIDLPDVQFEL